jgi:hypothetical protein
MEDDDVPGFVKADDHNQSKHSGNDEDDYETDEEYEISTRVDQEGNFRKTVVPSRAMMNRSLNNVSQILRESYHQNSNKAETRPNQLKDVMSKVSERPKEEKNLLLSLFTMMENATFEEKNQLLQVLGNNQFSQTDERMHNKYRLSEIDIEKAYFRLNWTQKP